MKRLALLLVLLPTSALAQTAEYYAPSRELWVSMVQAMQNVPMSMAGHNQMVQILASVQQQAKAEQEAKAKQERTDAKQKP